MLWKSMHKISLLAVFLPLFCSRLYQLTMSSRVQDCSLIVWQDCQAVAVSQQLSLLGENTLYLSLIKAILSMEIFILYGREEGERENLFSDLSFPLSLLLIMYLTLHACITSIIKYFLFCLT